MTGQALAKARTISPREEAGSIQYGSWFSLTQFSKRVLPTLAQAIMKLDKEREEECKERRVNLRKEV